MANYAYISLTPALKNLKKSERVKTFEDILKKCVMRTLGSKWAIRHLSKDGMGSVENKFVTFIVYLPNTAGTSKSILLDAGQDVGFAIELQKDHVASRHGINPFERWAQGRVEEELAEYLERSILFDSTNRRVKHGTREYRRGKTYRDYFMREFPKHLSDDDKLYIENHKHLVPEGYW
jgi:hypothetical protein